MLLFFLLSRITHYPFAIHLSQIRNTGDLLYSVHGQINYIMFVYSSVPQQNHQ
jgi:hypothetical protein